MDGFVEFCGGITFLCVRAAINSLPLFAVVALITKIGRRWLSARSRFALWTLVMMRMLMPFSLPTPIGWGGLQDSPNLEGIDVSSFVWHFAPPESIESNLVPGDDQNRNETRPLHWFDVVCALISVTLPTTSGILALWMTVVCWRLYSRIRKASTSENPQWEELLREGCRQFGIRAKVQLRVLDNWNHPAIMGLFRPTILMPASISSFSVLEIKHILWHELAHIKRRDAGWNLLRMVVLCLQWWNPCFWLVQRIWLSERELACDALAIRHLDSPPTDYARTLLRFLEHFSNAYQPATSATVIGLFFFSSKKSEMSRRLKNLSQPVKTESKLGRRGSFALIAMLAIMGLSDAASTQIENRAIPQLTIHVPPGTHWELSSAQANEELAQIPETTRVYNIDKSLARIRVDAPNAGREDICTSVHYGGVFPWIEGKPQLHKCILQDGNLIVTANERQHQAVQSLLEHWEQFGQHQIAVETRIIRTEQEPSAFVFGSKSRIISPTYRKLERSMPDDMQRTANDLVSSPTFVSVLTPSEVKSALTALQADGKTSCLIAPKASFFSGVGGCISDAKCRPFVTGIKTTSEGNYPDVSVVEDGFKIWITPKIVAPDNRIQLKLHLRVSSITDVEVLKTRIDGQAEVCVQIPHVNESNLKTSIELMPDETYLIAPLLPDPSGRFIFMFTSRVIQ